jgi:hypothetical protein
MVQTQGFKIYYTPDEHFEHDGLHEWQILGKHTFADSEAYLQHQEAITQLFTAISPWPISVHPIGLVSFG